MMDAASGERRDKWCGHPGQQSPGDRKIGVKMNILSENFGFLRSFEMFSQIKGNSSNDWVCFTVYSSC